MNTGDEGHLRARLGAALDQLDPGPLPLDAVVRRGRTAMIHRRVLVAAAVVVVVAAALAVPRLSRYLAAPPPSAPTWYHVIVHQGSGQRVITYGRVITSLNDMRWSVSGVGSGRAFRLRWHMAGLWQGQLFRAGAGSWDDAARLPTSPANPVSVFDVAYPFPELVSFVVRADVSHLVVGLSNGQTVTLWPVAAAGRARPRVAAIAVPTQTSITQISAYSARGELGYTVPYGVLAGQSSWLSDTTYGDFQIVRWLKPGQPALPKAATYSIAHGTARGTAWSEQLQVGPWGTCVLAPTGPSYGDCSPAIGRGLLGGKATALLSAVDFGQDRLGWDALVLAPSVSSVVARMPDGRSVRVRIYSHDGVKFATVVWSGGARPTRWTAYSASGQVLGSDSF